MAECTKYIVQLLGICSEDGQYAMIMEYMQRGSLNEVLSDKKIELPWSLRFRIAIGIGKGLA